MVERGIHETSSLAFLLLGGACVAQGPPAPYSVVLNWTVSVTPGVTSQKVYRAPYTGSCGTYVNITSPALAATVATYTDSSIVSGNAYCYATTALVGTAESGFSNIASNVQIPPAPPTGLSGTVQ